MIQYIYFILQLLYFVNNKLFTNEKKQTITAFKLKKEAYCAALHSLLINNVIVDKIAKLSRLVKRNNN